MEYRFVKLQKCRLYVRCSISFEVMLSEVHKLVLLYLTVPVTTVTAERSFSGLKRIKNISEKLDDPATS